ncbi:acyltransferase family protein [Aquabacterium sp.]|uniref:acyltransferase family protein n=1 Tax=Aquabacterium sp. TaxID=1872578 RepID=UPI0035C741F7
MSKQRNPVVDAARALGIALVVVGHNYLITRDQKDIHDWIYSFHMPLFMMLSGVFFSPRTTPYQSIQHKAKSLLKPYITVSVISAAVAALPQPSAQKAITIFGKVMLGSIIAAPGTIEWMPLWFLPHLFVVQVTATLLYTKIKNPIAITAISLIGVTLGQHLFFDKGLPWGIDLTPVSCGYFLLGHLLFPQAKKTLSRPLVCSILSVGVGGIWAIAFIFLAPQVDFHLRVYSGANAFVVAMIGCSFAMCLCGAIQQWPRLAQPVCALGQYSLYILLFHGWIQGKITGTLASRFESTWIPACAGAAGAIFVSVLLGKLIERTRIVRPLFLPGGSKQPITPPRHGSNRFS